MVEVLPVFLEERRVEHCQREKLPALVSVLGLLAGSFHHFGDKVAIFRFGFTVAGVE